MKPIHVGIWRFSRVLWSLSQYGNACRSFDRLKLSHQKCLSSTCCYLWICTHSTRQCLLQTPLDSCTQWNYPI